MSADVVQPEDVHALARLARAVCPACGSLRAVRSRRRTVADHLLGLLGLRPFRCQSCRWRFHAWPGLRLLLEPARNGVMAREKSRR